MKFLFQKEIGESNRKPYVMPSILGTKLVGYLIKCSPW